MQKGLTSKTVFELRSGSVGIEMMGLWGSKRLSVPYLRTQALTMHAATLADEIHKLAWLKDLGAISETEFARLKGAVNRDADLDAQGQSQDPLH